MLGDFMEQKISNLSQQLWSLTADLRPAAEGTRDDLHRARVAIASALASGESSVASRSAPAVSRTPLEPTQALQELLDTAVSESSPELVKSADFVVARREVPLAIAGLSSLTPSAVAGQAIDVSFGPFLDQLGRPVWIDLYRIVRQVRLVRVAGGAPFLVLPIGGLLGTESGYKLGSGSVWIASQQLAIAAPASSYTGILIKGGSVKFSSSLPHTGLEIVVPPTVTCTLALDLNDGAAPGGTGAGQDARLSNAKLPAKATFVFAHGGSSVKGVSSASFTVYGSTVDVDVIAGVAIYDAALSQVLYNAKTTAATFEVKDVRSDQFVPAETASIHQVAWALPVAVTSASSLGSAAGAGSLAMFLDSGLTVAWKGQATPLPAGPLVVLVVPGLITVVALQVLGLGTKESILLWSDKPGDPPTSQLTLGWKSTFAIWFFSSSSGSEILAMFGAIDGNFDRPITVGGRRVYVHSDLALILFIESAAFTGFIVEAALQPPPVRPNAPLAFSIANAVFRTTQAKSLILVAAFDGVQANAGGLALGFGLQYLLPILPDPYAANFDVAVRQLNDTGVVGVLSAIVLWAPALKPVLTYTLPGNATSALLGAQTNLARDVVADQSAAAVGFGAVVLLDLSTNVDQFGVAWKTNPSERGAGPNALAVDSMFLESPSDSVYVLTVPSVLWEPVYTDPPPSPPYPAGYPSPISFPNSGGPTTIGVQSVNLVRVAPAPALDNLVGNFTTSPAPSTATARLTLPFGMEAFATLNKSAGPAFKGANVAYNRPKFTAESVIGGYQISLNAVDPAFPDSPAFQGYTIQLQNTLFNGVPTAPPVSILGVDVDTIFNGYLGPGGTNQLVPVTRIDLSGYGESLFSNWRNETNDVTAVSKARFDVLIGRTSVEVVQVRSILYPYGVRVVRTITIDRKNTGVVTRHDSGWQASSDGVYDFAGSTLTVHPGVVQKIVNVVNIRDTGQLIDVGGAQVAGVFFDGDLVIDGITKGGGLDGVPARNQIGYIQLTPEKSGGPLTDAQYEQLIQRAGPLGGGVDCVLNVATSGLMMKLGRVGVGVTQGMSGPEFVMTAWGSPQFPYGGQWSFLKQTGPGTAPELVNTDLGVPLIRSGPVPNPPPPSSAYRFADPEDLANAASPASDYGIVHATGTQRVFFQRPKIDANALNQITSTVAPTLADPYSLANSVGLFPRTDAAIPFPNANYSLDISGGGAIKLQLPSPTFPVTVGQRTISEAGGVRAYADYTGATATISIDTAAAVSWTFQLQDVNVATSSTLMGEVLRLKASVEASASAETRLKNSQMIFGGALGPVQSILTFLSSLGFPSPLNVSMTNSVKVKAGLKIPMDDELNKLLPPGGPQFADTDVVVSLVINNPISEADFELGATILIPTPFDPLMAVGLVKIQIQMSTASGNTFTLTVGVGLGVSFKVGGFGVTAYFAETMFFIVGDTVLGFGVGMLIKGSIDLEIISVDVSVEAKMAILKVSCPGVTIYGAAQVTFAIEITICWVIDIDIEVQAEADQNLNGGPCALPDVL
jgi:hypothetical protein